MNSSKDEQAYFEPGQTPVLGSTVPPVAFPPKYSYPYYSQLHTVGVLLEANPPKLESTAKGVLSEDKVSSKSRAEKSLAESTSKELIARLDTMRREKHSLEMSPLNSELTEIISEMTGQAPGDCDYSTFGNIIDRAKAALDESLPLGQYARSGLAVSLMITSVNALRIWMELKGFDTDLLNLDRVLRPEFTEDNFGEGVGAGKNGGSPNSDFAPLGPFVIDKGTFAPSGKLISAVKATVGVRDLYASNIPVGKFTKKVTVVKSRACTVSHTENNIERGEKSANKEVMRFQRVGCSFGKFDTSFGFRCPDMFLTEVEVIDTEANGDPTPTPRATVTVERAETVTVTDLDSTTAVLPSQKLTDEQEVRLIKMGNEKEFIEPGTGLLMEKSKWYVVTDSGSFYESMGFDSSLAADGWYLYSEFYERDKASAQIPILNKESGVYSSFGLVNIVLGADMYNFWRMTDPEMLLSAEEMHRAHLSREEAVASAKKERVDLLKSVLEVMFDGVISSAEETPESGFTRQDVLSVAQAVLDRLKRTSGVTK